MTDKEIVERAKEAGKRTGFGELVHSPISKGVNSAYGIGFIEGMVEYRNSLQKEPVKIDRQVSKMADEFAEREYETDGYERQWLGKGYYHGYMDANKGKLKEPVSNVWHRGDEFKDIEYQRICKKVIGNMENKRFAIGDVMEVENGAIDLLYEDGCVAMCIRKEDTWAYLDDLLDLSNIERAVKNYKEPVSEDLEKAAVEAFKQIVDSDKNNFLEIFKAGAKWQAEQFEKNRLAACDRQAEEEAEIERDFVMSIIENEHRQPTFDDAIKYGMRLQKERLLAKVVDGEDSLTLDGVITFDYYDGDKAYGCVAHDSFCLEDWGLKDMDKVKILILKKVMSYD